MSQRTYTVRCLWDPEAEVWVATSDDVPRLATGAELLDALVDKLKKLKIVVPDLLEAKATASLRTPGVFLMAIDVSPPF